MGSPFICVAHQRKEGKISEKKYLKLEEPIEKEFHSNSQYNLSAESRPGQLVKKRLQKEAEI